MASSASPVYLDSNVVLYSVIADRVFGKSCAQVMEQVEGGSLRVAASVLVITEVANAIRRLGRARDMEKVATALTSLPVRFHDLTESLVMEGVRIGRTTGISPYDGIHAATMTALGLQTIVSADKDFDKVLGITRIDPRALAGTGSREETAANGS